MTWTYHLHPHDAVASVHMQFCTPTQIKLKNIVIYFDKLTWELKVQTKKSDILSMWMSWMTPRKEESVYRELTAADLATFCTGVKMNKKLGNNFLQSSPDPQGIQCQDTFSCTPQAPEEKGWSQSCWQISLPWDHLMQRTPYESSMYVSARNACDKNFNFMERRTFSMRHIFTEGGWG